MGVGRRGPAAGGGGLWFVVCSLFCFKKINVFLNKCHAPSAAGPHALRKTGAPGRACGAQFRRKAAHMRLKEAVCFSLLYFSSPCRPAGREQQKPHHPDASSPSLHLTVSSCRTGVVAGRAGWGIWGGCSAKRRPRNMASAAEKRRRRKDVVVETTHLSTECEWPGAMNCSR